MSPTMKLLFSNFKHRLLNSLHCSGKKLVSISSSTSGINKCSLQGFAWYFYLSHLDYASMNPVQNCSTTKAVSKLSSRTKGKKKKDVGINNAYVAETRAEFVFDIARVAVAQICQSFGFKTSQYSALENLTTVSMKYLEAIVRSAASFANASNRTDSNLFDLINGIHDLCSVQGFSGGSVVHESDLVRSTALQDIMNFVKLSREVPFAKPIPVSKDFKITIDSGSSYKTQGLHIPGWLPDFPMENFNRKFLVKERKCGEKLWELSLDTEDCSGTLQSNDINRDKEDNPRMELVKRRERVKFKIGVVEEKQIAMGLNTMNGVCKGRKRVYWNRDKINNCIVEKDEDEKR